MIWNGDRRRPGVSRNGVICSVIFVCVLFHPIFISAADTQGKNIGQVCQKPPRPGTTSALYSQVQSDE
jgi:hypothetical protein